VHGRYQTPVDGDVPVAIRTLHSEPLHVTLPAIDPLTLMETTNQPSEQYEYQRRASMKWKLVCAVLQSGARVPQHTLETILESAHNMC
jgi:hypothetical protein